MLKELEKNMDGYQNSVKTIMRAASARRLRGIIGPVSSILSVEPGREVAIETALGGALQNIEKVVGNPLRAVAFVDIFVKDETHDFCGVLVDYKIIDLLLCHGVCLRR